MPLPQPVAGLDVPSSGDTTETGGDSDASTEDLECASGRSADRSPDKRWSPLRPSDGGLVGGGGQHRVETAGGAAGAATGAEGNAAANDGDVSLRFVCQVEAARLLATTAMGVLGDGGGGGGGGGGEAGEGEEECARVLEAAEAFFATFERTYSG